MRSAGSSWQPYDRFAKAGITIQAIVFVRGT
jgi:hypothetical protein